MRILYVTQELDPFTAISSISESFRRFPQFFNDKSNEIRVLMPKFGLINERRHRLHEVVRLSGMNIIVDDEDYPLIIKVASFPGARIQVYFLDNDEFFKRKNAFTDEEGNAFPDNHERLVFFCKGVMETVRKFGWPPDIIHCVGPFTSLVPLYTKKVYQNDPIFGLTKIVYSAYTDPVGQSLNKEFGKIAAINDLGKDEIKPYVSGQAFDLNAGAAHYADALIVEDADIVTAMASQIKKMKDKALDFSAEEKDMTRVNTFYKNLLDIKE